MFLMRSIKVLAIMLTVFSTTAFAADSPVGNCPVSGGPANAKFAVDYKGGKVYFCCENCPASFANDPKKFAVKANHQLVVSGQFEQTTCPLSGGELADGTAVDVSGVAVQFCCENCQGKVAKATGDAQAELVFADAAFDKSFALKEAAPTFGSCPVSGGPASEKFAVDYKGGKIYFCCEKCPASFAKDPKKFAVKANHQLVVSGQFEQTACPMSGGELADGTSVDVAGVAVQFCCENCQGKVAKATGDAQAELVFADAAFDKSFALTKAEESESETEDKDAAE